MFGRLFGKKKEEYHEIIVEKHEPIEDMATKAKKELFNELYALGIYAKNDYKVGHTFVDMGFPNERIAVEVIGDVSEEEKTALKKKYSALKAFGWKVYGFAAQDVYTNAKDYAGKIKRVLGYHKKW